MTTKVAAKTINIDKSAQAPVHVPAPSQVLSRIMKTLYCWQERSRERHQLREMDDHFLSDMGISREDAFRESSKPFWKE